MSFKDMNAENFDIDTIKELAYVMNLQAQGTDIKAVTIEDYYTWLEQFEESDVLQNAVEVIGTWMQNVKTTTKSKKK